MYYLAKIDSIHILILGTACSGVVVDFLNALGILRDWIFNSTVTFSPSVQYYFSF